MSLYTSNYLKNLSRQYSINENYRASLSSNKDAKFDIFISHSYLDREEVRGLYVELTNLGYTVYVDWIIDAHLDRTTVTKQTAQLIRHRLKCSKTLLLAISANAEMSKWMPWELGYVDGNTNKCAIIPVAKENTILQSFKRVEYLLLYPFIKKEQNQMLQEKLWAVEESDVYIIFEDWIKGKVPFKRDTKIF